MNEKIKYIMNPEILTYNQQFSLDDRKIADELAKIINENLPEAESKIWHSHPVWFLEGNPIVGYSKQKAGIRLMFWSGADFEEADLEIGSGKFKDASVFYGDVTEVDVAALKRWLEKAKTIQWDYKNIVKHKGVLERLK